MRAAPADVAAFVDYVRREAQLDDGVCCAALILLERVVVVRRLHCPHRAPVRRWLTLAAARWDV